MYQIPLFNVNFNEQEEHALLQVIRSKWISTGPICCEFEKAFASELGAKHALTQANCTAALHMVLRLLDIGIGDEVIVPSLTFVATVNAVKYTGATPIFADIESLENLTISVADIRKKLSSRTKAIIVMHYGGFPCEMNSIMTLAKEKNLKIVEDTAHAPLSEYKKQKLGTYGDIGCFSFFSNKNISCGEGGMIVTNNDQYYEKAKILRSHGMTSMSFQRALGHATEYDVIDVGYNYRMDDLRAALGIEQLKKLSQDLESRAEIRDYYIQRLRRSEKIIIPFLKNEEYVSNYIFPVVLKDSNSKLRDQIRSKLSAVGIQTSVHYPSVHRFSSYKLGYQLPFTEYASDNEITLPMYAQLRREDLDYVINNLIKCINENI